MFFEDLEGSLVLQSLMRSLCVVVHFPQPVLITPMLGVMEALTEKAFFVVSAIAAFDDAVFPGTGFLDQSVDSASVFDGFGKSGFAFGMSGFGMSGIAHREIHGVVGKSDEKGGRLSTARW